MTFRPYIHAHTRPHMREHFFKYDFVDILEHSKNIEKLEKKNCYENKTFSMSKQKFK